MALVGRPSICLPVSPFVHKHSSALSLPYFKAKLVLKFWNYQHTCEWVKDSCYRSNHRIWYAVFRVSDGTQYAKLLLFCTQIYRVTLKYCRFYRGKRQMLHKANNQNTFARTMVPLHDTNTICIFFIEMQMANCASSKRSRSSRDARIFIVRCQDGHRPIVFFPKYLCAFQRSYDARPGIARTIAAEIVRFTF